MSTSVHTQLMPSNVRLFERLWVASLFLGLGVLAIDGPRIAAKPEVAAAGLGPMVVIGVVTFAIMVLLLWLTSRRRKNWTRWLLLILTIAGMPFAVLALRETVQQAPLVAALSVGQILLQLAGLWLVFSGNAKPWFAKQTGTAA